jgi:hypothetical protein
MATSPNYGWLEPDNTDLLKNGALAIRTLGNAIDSTMATMTPKSTVTAKGSLIAATAASTPANLAVGASNKLSLQVDSTTATGLAWQQQGLTFIARTTFSNVASQAFDSVFTSTYKTYMIVLEGVYAATPADDLHLQMRYGTTTTTTGYYYGGAYQDYTGGSGVRAGNNVGMFLISEYAGLSGQGTHGTLTFNQVGNASELANLRGQTLAMGASTNFNISGNVADARTYTGFLLKSSSSNITGTVSIYGLAAA